MKMLFFEKSKAGGMVLLEKKMSVCSKNKKFDDEMKRSKNVMWKKK